MTQPLARFDEVVETGGLSSIRDDIVDSSVVRDPQSDRFGHQHFAEEIGDLVTSVDTPASIALFAPWGSGKSSLGELLRAWLSDNGNVPFVRYDAFKYAEVPLRRHFLSQVAEQIDPKWLENANLYDEETQARFQTPSWKTWGRVVAVLASTFTVATAAITLLAALAAWAIMLLSEADYTDTLGGVLDGWLPQTTLITVVIGSVLAIAGRVLTIDRTTSSPSSDEQFERLFRDLVSGPVTKYGRVVVFIDELDRCAPNEVVETLDALRTFLDVEGCVYVVAADRNAIESAIAESARQATPVDDRSPYYSTGGSYLDKVFAGHQIDLPTPLPRRLNDYALRLVDTDPKGIWVALDRQRVVSVLVPSHVRSPRRVKVLLNAFAHLYRLALRRAENGMLDTDLADRAPEIAKLTTLKREFPRFVDELANHPGLCAAYVHAWEAIRDSALPQRPEHAAVGDEVDSHVVDEDAEDDRDGFVSKPTVRDALLAGFRASTPRATASRALDVVSDDRWSPVALIVSDDPESVADGSPIATLRESLYAYLKRTEVIGEPRPDIIRLESSGQVFGLDEPTADTLATAAVDGNTDRLVEVVTGLDPSDRTAALRLLTAVAKETPPGLEADNVVRVISVVAKSVGDSELQPVARELIDAIRSHAHRPSTWAQWDPDGLLRLGLADPNHAAAQDLIETAADRVGPRADVGLLKTLFSQASVVGSRASDAVVSAARWLALRSSMWIGEALATDDRARHDAFRASADLLVESATSNERNVELARRVLPALAEQIAQLDDLAAETRAELLVPPARALLALDIAGPGASLGLDALGALAGQTYTDLDLITQILALAEATDEDDDPSFFATALGYIGDDAVSEPAAVVDLLWTKCSPFEGDDEWAAAVGECRRVVASGTDRADLSGTATSLDDVLAQKAAPADADYVRDFHRFVSLVELGLADPTPLDGAASALIALASTPVASVPDVAAAQRIIEATAIPAAKHAPDHAEELVTACDACAWLDEPLKMNVVTHAAHEHGLTTNYAAGDYGHMAKSYGRDAHGAVLWLMEHAREHDLRNFLRENDDRLPNGKEWGQSATEAVRRLTTDEWVDLLVAVGIDTDNGEPDERTIRALVDVDDEDAKGAALAKIEAAYADATNNAQRESLIKLTSLLRLESDEHRARYILGILLPTAEGNNQGANIVARYRQDWATPPVAIHGQVRERLINTAGRSRPMQNALDKAGWRKRSWWQKLSG
ncbi:MAG: P-loop NTPase fold protein [Actinomycetota bacterium]